MPFESRAKTPVICPKDKAADRIPQQKTSDSLDKVVILPKRENNRVASLHLAKAEDHSERRERARLSEDRAACPDEHQRFEEHRLADHEAVSVS